MAVLTSKEFFRITADRYGPSNRLPEAIMGRYQAGETIKELAHDYVMLQEQIEWGIRIEYLRAKLAAAEAREAQVRALVGKWGDREFRKCRCAACQVIVRHADELLAALGEKEPKP